jgi:hypothetical protein
MQHQESGFKEKRAIINASTGRLEGLVDPVTGNVELLHSTVKCGKPGTHTSWHLLTRKIIPAILTLIALFSLFRAIFVRNHHYRLETTPLPIELAENVGAEEKVPLEIHVMSKCPDARDCLRELIVPTMVRVSEKVNLTMSFIGRYALDSAQ